MSASELMRSLLRSIRPSTLTRAIGASGRIPKRLYILAYVDDERYRRRILTQLNRGESRHTAWLGLSFMGNAANCGSAIVEARR